ncbi:MAG: hypothetical protein ABI615_00840 [Chthoniobacterales bacterium]
MFPKNVCWYFTPLAGIIFISTALLHAENPPAASPSPQSASPVPSASPQPTPIPRHSVPAAPGLLPDAAKKPNSPAYLKQSIPAIYSPSPDLQCPSVDAHSWRTWQDVGKAMSKAPTCSLFQNWKDTPDAGLRPATVAFAHDGDKLIVYAEIEDDVIYNTTTENGKNFYLTGDAIELLLLGDKEPTYMEHNLSPDNLVLQFCWPLTTIDEIEAGKHPHWQTEYAGDVSVQSCTLVQQDKKLWRVLMVVPLKKVASTLQGKNGELWHFSIGRYDKKPEDKRVMLSASSAYDPLPWRGAKFIYPNYHEQAVWGKLTLIP